MTKLHTLILEKAINCSFKNFYVIMFFIFFEYIIIYFETIQSVNEYFYPENSFHYIIVLKHKF